MNSEENLSRLCEYRFLSKQEIFNFNEKLIPAPYILLSTCSGIAVELSVQAESILPENKDYMVIRIKEYHGNKKPPILPSLTCIINILDVDGNMKFPRTFEFQCCSKAFETASTHLKYFDFFVEERYIKKSSILDNASEYLQQNILTIVYEGSLREWVSTSVPISFYDSPEGSFVFLDQKSQSSDSSNFNIKHCAEGFKILLSENSRCVQHLIEHSEFFKEMFNILIKQHSSEQETIDDDIPLKTEELPAFLCMLVFIETRQLFLYKTSINDLYKIADKYVIPTLLKECRSVIIKTLSKNTAPNILKFAQFYYDKELEAAAQSCLEEQLHETEKYQNFEMTNDFDDAFNTHPISSSVIKTEEDFRNFLAHVERQVGSFELFSKTGPQYVEIYLFDEKPNTEIFDTYV